MMCLSLRQTLNIARAVKTSYGVNVFRARSLPNRKSQRAAISLVSNYLIVNDQYVFYNASRMTRTLWYINESYRRLDNRIDTLP